MGDKRGVEADAVPLGPALRTDGTLAYGSVGEARINEPIPAQSGGTLRLGDAPPGDVSSSLADTILASHGQTLLPKMTLAAGSGRVALESNASPRYREHARLGAGGIGEVTLATDEDIGRNVAIKRLLNPTDDGLLLRFVDEVKVLGQLDHPNIVPVHDVGRDQEGKLFFVMKKLDGQTLESVIEKLRAGDVKTLLQYPLDIRVEVFMNVLRALQFAHARRILHRDIKPANIMVGAFGEVVVMDWGIAKRLDDPISDAVDAQLLSQSGHLSGQRRTFQTQAGALLGTPAYMSPEQARGEVQDLDERSDVYSLSVVFYEFLTLRHYLEDIQDVEGLLRGVQDREPVPPQDIKTAAGRVPVELSNFVLRGLNKQRDKRYRNVSEMIQALHRVQNGTFEISCPATLTKRGLLGLGRAIDAHSKPVATSVLAGFALFVATLVYWLVRLVT